MHSYLEITTPFKDELTEMDRYVIRDNRLVIPVALRPRMLEFAHEGHPGNGCGD